MTRIRVDFDSVDRHGFTRGRLDRADGPMEVDSLNVDWNAEAVEAAESYLEFQAFSRQGLIDQLSSPYGHQFTVEQATYGADHAL